MGIRDSPRSVRLYSTFLFHRGKMGMEELLFVWYDWMLQKRVRETR